jgi:hypothetical protein
MFFMACMAETPHEEAKEQYRALGKIARDAAVSSDQLESAFA